MKPFRSLEIDPIVFFWVFVVSNAVLSYFSVPLPVKGWVFMMGVLLPLLLLFFRPGAAQKKPFEKGDDFSVSSWIWVLLGVFGLGLRFFKLTSFHLWPTGDEGLHGFLAIGLVQHWNWRFFYTVGEHPPLLIWFLAFFFKFFKSPFFNLWFLPACFSAITVPMGYLAVRNYFSKNVSFLFVFLLTLSYWPLYFGRFCHQGVFIPFFELTGFWLLGSYLRAPAGSRKSRLVFFLGLWAGLGSLTFTSWAVVLLLLSLTVLAVFLKKYPLENKSLGWFSTGLLAALLPFLIAAYREGYGHHLIDSSAASHWFSRSHQLLTHLSYGTCFFWGTLQSGSSYAPTWGGILNPILAAGFFLGLAELFRFRKALLAQWIGGAFLVCFLPGLLSADYVEFNRVIQTLPLLLLITSIGLAEGLGGFFKNKKAALVLLAAVSVALDVTHLIKPNLVEPYSKLEFKTTLPDEGFRAYQIFSALEKQKGPGLLFTDFMLLSHGHMLSTACYHFNAALNRGLDSQSAQWAAVVVNRHYRPFLQKRFPDSKWFSLTTGPADDGGMEAGVIPVTPQNRAVFDHWKIAHDYFHHLSLQAENILNDKKTYDDAVSHLMEGYPLMKGDPFLESLFGEWLAQYHYGPTLQENISILQEAIQRGYPSAHLFYKLGGFYVADRDWARARWAYSKAAASRDNATNAGEILGYLRGK